MLADLRERLRRTRWPEAATTGGWEQGPPVGYVRDLCRYWAEEYDWRAAEARLAALGQFRTAVTDRVDVPAGCSIFPRENPRPSRRWAARRFTDIRYWSEPARGRHFAAFEQPELFVEEVRACLRAFR